MKTTKHTGTLHQYDPPISFTVYDFDEPDSVFDFYRKDDGATVAISPSLIEAAIRQIEKDRNH